MCPESGIIEQIQKSEEQYRRAFENAPSGICMAGLDGSILRVNAALCRMVGYSEEEMLATVWGELDDPDASGPSLERLQQLLQDPGGSVEAEKRYIHRNGSVVWGRMRASMVRDGEGKPLYFVIHCEDITGHKRVEDVLHESEERFRIMADGCPTMMWVSNAEGGVQFINRASREFFGITYEEVEGGKWQLLVHPDDAPEYAKRLQRALHDYTAFKIEVRVRRADGEWRWVATCAEPRLSSSGEFLGHVGLSSDITERKQAEQLLQFQHSLLRAIHEGSPDGILVVNHEGTVVSHNQRYLDIWQISQPAIPKHLSVTSMDSPFHEFFSACLNRVKDPEPFLQRVRELYDDPGAKDQCEIELKDGRTIERYSSGLRSKRGEYLGRVWFFRDITTRKQADHDLHRSDEKFRQFAENIHEVIWMMPMTAGEKPYVSPAYEQVWGKTCESLYQNPRSWLEAIHPDDLEPARQRFAVQLAGEAAESQYRIRTPDGQEKWIRDRTFPVFDSAGQLIRVVGIAEEITERKQAEAESSRKTAFLEAQRNATVDGILVVDNKGEKVFQNEQFLRLWKTPQHIEEEKSDRSQLEYVASLVKDPDKFMEKIQYLNDHPEETSRDEIELRDGKVLDRYSAPVLGKLDKHYGRIWTFRDVTERRQHEDELRESEVRFRSVVEGAPVGIYIQTDGILRYLNPSALRMFGAESVDQIVGQNLFDRIHPDSHKAVIERAKIVTQDGNAVPLLEERHLRIDGSAFDTENSAEPFFFEGRPGVIVFFRDITERKREENRRRELEQQLRQSQKMEAVGRLAGGIAHDFNNLLMVIQTYTEMLQERLPIEDGLRRNTEQVLKAAERGASLTGQMLAFSRKQIISPVVVDLNHVISETAKMLKRIIGEDIEFRVVSAQSLWAIEADPDQIVQILMNLCVNSRDAMPQGGMLTIATENVTLTGSLEGHADLSPGSYVRLAVTDTGTGISKELQEEIFEPFFTTKEVGQGTGLGLATVYGIVKQSGGYLWVDSEPGQGACFTIYLPKAERAVAPDVSPKVAASPRGTETLLVVEDEEFIREGICEFLRSLGYTVFAASSGHQALLVASEQEQIDLLLTDIVMPKMSGRELSQMLGSLRPGLKIIHMSGYTDDAVLRTGIHESNATFLQKPFSLGTLAHKVRDTLGSVRSTEE